FWLFRFLGCGLYDLLVVLDYRQGRSAGAGGALQSSTSRFRPGDRLPLLSHVGREILLRGHSTHRDVHDLPLARLDRCAHARARAPESRHPATAELETGE